MRLIQRLTISKESTFFWSWEIRAILEFCFWPLLLLPDPPILKKSPVSAKILNPLSPEGGWIFTPPWKNVFLKSWYLRFIKWDFKNWVNQWMATNISYILMHKSKFFETFLNNLQTVSIECQKRLKRIGILRVKVPYGKDNGVLKQIIYFISLSIFWLSGFQSCFMLL